MRDSAVERFYRAVRLFRVYDGTTQIQQLIIGRELAKRMGAEPGSSAPAAYCQS